MAKIFRDEITFEQHGNDPEAKRVLIFFLPGNPGVVEYYRDFLSDLHKSLTKDEPLIAPSSRRDSQHDPNIDIITYGHSHSGFELNTSNQETLVQPTLGKPPYNLAQEIEGAKNRLLAVANANAGTKEPLKVVLVGHSVGAYMLMELVNWWQQTLADNPNFGRHGFEVVGGVCLFPTVVDLEWSPRGKVMRWLLAIPFLPLAAAFLATILSLFIRPCLFDWPKALTPGDDPAIEYQEITQSVIESPYSARQAAYLAADEMKQIREDKWHPSHVWGAHDPEVTATEATIKSAAARTKLFFYWGRDDYWVDNSSRDKLIEKRARRVDDEAHLRRPTMMIDKHGMDHCFSLDREHCGIVARQVAEWVRELKDTL